MASELSLALAAAVKANHEEHGLTELCADVQGVVSGMAEMTPMETVAALTKSDEDMETLLRLSYAEDAVKYYPWTALAEAALGQIFDLHCDPDTHTMGEDRWYEMEYSGVRADNNLKRVSHHFDLKLLGVGGWIWRRFGEFGAELTKRGFVSAMRHASSMSEEDDAKLRLYLHDMCRAQVQVYFERLKKDRESK